MSARRAELRLRWILGTCLGLLLGYAWGQHDAQERIMAGNIPDLNEYKARKAQQTTDAEYEQTRRYAQQVNAWVHRCPAVYGALLMITNREDRCSYCGARKPIGDAPA